MTYWANGPNPDATETAGILRHSLEPLADANGNCLTWSALLRDCFRIQGIAADRIKAFPVSPLDRSILVRNWRFNEPPSGGGAYPYMVGADVFDLDGIPGQGNPNPWGVFNGHWITLCDGAYYDPSYGTAKAKGANKDKIYEDGALDGYGAAFPLTIGTGTRKNDRSSGSSSELNYMTDN